jgi:hypothetical protein
VATDRTTGRVAAGGTEIATHARGVGQPPGHDAEGPAGAPPVRWVDPHHVRVRRERVDELDVGAVHVLDARPGHVDEWAVRGVDRRAV